MLLEQIQNPDDIKNFSDEELKALAQEIREFLIEKISVTGGHLASNLGVVELPSLPASICRRTRWCGMWGTRRTPTRS